MPAHNGDVYQVVDTQVFNGQTCLNVYFYKATDVPLGADASDVTAAFIETVLPTLTPLQVNDVVHTSIKATNLFDPTDQNEELISTAGEGSGDPLGTFEAYPFRLIGDNASVRSGSKRIAGVPEDATTNGVVTASGVITDLDATAAILAAGVLFGLLDAGTLVPVIVKRLLVDGEYILPDNAGDAVLSNVVDALFSPLVTSQVSRKVGRGE